MIKIYYLISTGIVGAGILIGYLMRFYIINSYQIKFAKVPLIEVIISLAFLISYILFGFSIHFFEMMFLSVMIVLVGSIDYKTRTIPDRIVAFIAFGGFVFMILNYFIRSEGPLEKIIGIVAASLPMYIVSLSTKDSIGGGDIKFMAAAGLFLGWRNSLVALFFSMTVGALVLVVLLLLKIIKKNTLVPLGPFLAIGIFMSAVFS